MPKIEASASGSDFKACQYVSPSAFMNRRGSRNEGATHTVMNAELMSEEELNEVNL